MSQIPLVSVAVLTYNSSEYVIETLNSIYNQTYKNLELIITDDCSKDNTIEICKSWIETHKNRFVNVNLLISDNNTGVSANANRGYRAAKGVWIKGIAGDDILLPNCIELYVNYFEKHPNVELCVSKVQSFSSSINGEKIHGSIFPSLQNQQMFDMSAHEQMIKLLEENIVPAPALIMKRDIYIKYPFMDIYKCMEDLPFLINVTKNNVKIDFLNEITTLYRISGKSISHVNNMLYPTKMYETKVVYYLNEKKDLMKTYAPHLIRKEEKDLLLWLMSEVFFKNKRTILSKIVLKIANILI